MNSAAVRFGDWDSGSSSCMTEGLLICCRRSWHTPVLARKLMGRSQPSMRSRLSKSRISSTSCDRCKPVPVGTRPNVQFIGMRSPVRPRLTAAALWEFAVKALAMRAHSTGELRRKLVQKAEKPADVEETISRLRDYGYVNDRRFAENFAGARLGNQGLGKS